MLIRGVVSSPIRGVVGSPVLSGGFSLAAFMASQSAGFWYDFTRTDTMFQEDVGPTPADEPNEVIGLALSQRLWGGQTRAGYLAGQPELVTNGDFSAGSVAWGNVSTGTGTLTIGSGAATIVGTNGTNRGALSQNLGMVIGRLYWLTFDATIFGGTAYIGGSAVGSGGVVVAAGLNAVYFVAASESIIAYTASSGGNVRLDSISVREVSQVPATQSTTSFKPKFQLVGATGDGTDDRAVTNYAAGSGENFLMLPATTVPVTLAGTQVLAGAMDGSANGAYIAITTAGALRVKWGATTLDSTGVDLRNGVRDVGLWTDNGTLYLFADGVVVGSGAWTGTIPTTTWNLWALNNNGTASNFFAGSLKAALAGREAINLARAIQICANA